MSIFYVNTSFGTPSVTRRNFNMTKPKNGSSVSEENYIPVKEDKLKDEQRAELDKSIEAYKA